MLEDKSDRKFLIPTAEVILTNMAKDKIFNNAKRKVYEIVKKIKWKNCFFRKDIGFRAKKLR